MTRSEFEADMTASVGLVPSFMKSNSDDALEAEWALFKRMTFADKGSERIITDDPTLPPTTTTIP